MALKITEFYQVLMFGSWSP